MKSDSQTLIEVCLRLPELLENPRSGQVDAVFHFPDSQGKHNIDIKNGQWFDFRSGKGGHSPVGLVMDVRDWSKSEAVAWLKREGIFKEEPYKRTVGRFKGRSVRVTPPPNAGRRRLRAHTNHRPKKKVKPGGMIGAAQRIWAESEPIGDFDGQHPFRRWVTIGDKPGILGDQAVVPGNIRWHKGMHSIVGLRNTFEAWKEGRQTCFSISGVKIDHLGNKRLKNGKKGSDKFTYGSGADGVFIGDPNNHQVALCEGLADALALHLAWELKGVIWATAMPITRILNVLGVCEWLAGRDVVIYTDADKTGQDAGNEVWAGIMEWSPKIEPRVVAKYPGNAKDPAAAVVHFDQDNQNNQNIEKFETSRESRNVQKEYAPYWVLWGGSVLEQNFKKHVMGVNGLTQF